MIENFDNMRLKHRSGSTILTESHKSSTKCWGSDGSTTEKIGRRRLVHVPCVCLLSIRSNLFASSGCRTKEASKRVREALTYLGVLITNSVLRRLFSVACSDETPMVRRAAASNIGVRIVLDQRVLKLSYMFFISESCSQCRAGIRGHPDCPAIQDTNL